MSIVIEPAQPTFLLLDHPTSSSFLVERQEILVGKLKALDDKRIVVNSSE